MRYVFAFLFLSACAIDAREPAAPVPTPAAPEATPAPPVATPQAAPVKAPEVQTLDLRELVSPIFSLVRADRVAEVATHLREVNEPGPDGRLPIFEARSYEMARLLWDVSAVRTRAQPATAPGGEWRDHEGRLALHVWASEGRARPVQFAVERHCGDLRDYLRTSPLDAVDGDGRTALMLVARSGNLETWDVLLACQSVRLDVADKTGRTALHEVIERGDSKFLIGLIARRPREIAALLDARDDKARTPWTMALQNDHVDMIVLLSALRR